ncbi:polymorphic toxin type 15 domain-containing protein [Clostridium estertheticum]|uniref:polymorphic toxin type 15 domain-containing protein n=1 Tax=Clostridium estertheticum TaxID=238834 RepID=UPI001CF1FEDA|nr:polymorphic toxin type 15 domain-containing protein [Clostridium estertheticum]MCB2343365.1 polymorphic toxin type 15 domain-containing protein [Clostridium estertheticum]
MFYFGRPSKTSYKLEDTSDYKACKDLKQYHESGGSEAGHDTDYFYYEIETREKYEVGASISFKNKDFYVNQYKARALSDEVIYKYRLCRKNGVWQTKVINSLIGGASIEGKVLEVKGEKIKLHLNIDKSQNKDKASWFPYAPPTGNVMYSMPIVGTSASLYFPSETSEEPIVTGCVRTNGSSCTKTADTTKRYFGTEHGSEIEMVPNALNIKGGSKEPLSISFDDAVGVTIKSHKKLSLNAAGGITMKTPQSVKLKAQSQILVAKAGTKSGFSMETDLHFLSNNVMKNGSDREAFAAFDDEPTVGKKPELEQVKKAALVKGKKLDPVKAKKKEVKKEEKKKGFNWGKLAGNVLAAVAVVAVVAAVVAVVVFTGGTAIPAVAGALAAVGTTAGAAAGMAFAGGMIMGGIGVAGKAISDYASGVVSDLSSYTSIGARESFVGALSGAIFGPYGAFKSYKGMMALGGLTNGVESVIRQTLEGKGINFKTLLLDAGFGAATAGMFHGAGKLFQKASPFVKKAFNKIASNISDNMKAAKIAFNNVDMPKDVKLACGLGGGDSKVAKEFVKQFKKAKSGIPKTSEVEVNFNRNLKHDAVEFERQLKDQEKGLNSLSVDEFIKNRNRYLIEGRSLEGNAAQKLARKESLKEKALELRKQGIDRKEAVKKAEEWIKSKAALHDPDQIAGGNPSKINGMGDKRINSSLGSQWKSRVKSMDKQIRTIAEQMGEEERKSTYLNIKLTH